MAKVRWQEMLDTRRNPSKQQRKERKAIMSGAINVTIKMDEADLTKEAGKLDKLLKGTS